MNNDDDPQREEVLEDGQPTGNLTPQQKARKFLFGFADPSKENIRRRKAKAGGDCPDPISATIPASIPDSITTPATIPVDDLTKPTPDVAPVNASPDKTNKSDTNKSPYNNNAANNKSAYTNNAFYNNNASYTNNNGNNKSPYKNNSSNNKSAYNNNASYNKNSYSNKSAYNNNASYTNNSANNKSPYNNNSANNKSPNTNKFAYNNNASYTNNTAYNKSPNTNKFAYNNNASYTNNTAYNKSPNTKKFANNNNASYTNNTAYNKSPNTNKFAYNNNASYTNNTAYNKSPNTNKCSNNKSAYANNAANTNNSSYNKNSYTNNNANNKSAYINKAANTNNSAYNKNSNINNSAYTKANTTKGESTPYVLNSSLVSSSLIVDVPNGNNMTEVSKNIEHIPCDIATDFIDDLKMLIEKRRLKKIDYNWILENACNQDLQMINCRKDFLIWCAMKHTKEMLLPSEEMIYNGKASHQSESRISEEHYKLISGIVEEVKFTELSFHKMAKDIEEEIKVINDFIIEHQEKLMKIKLLREEYEKIVNMADQEHPEDIVLNKIREKRMKIRLMSSELEERGFIIGEIKKANFQSAQNEVAISREKYSLSDLENNGLLTKASDDEINEFLAEYNMECFNNWITIRCESRNMNVAEIRIHADDFETSLGDLDDPKSFPSNFGDMEALKKITRMKPFQKIGRVRNIDLMARGISPINLWFILQRNLESIDDLRMVLHLLKSDIYKCTRDAFGKQIKTK